MGEIGRSASAICRLSKKRFNLPANDPKMIIYNGIDPGYNEAQLEGNLDLECGQQPAPNAMIYYVYGSSELPQLAAVNANYALIISISHGSRDQRGSLLYRRSYSRAMRKGSRY